MVPVCYQNERLVEAEDPAPTLLEVSRRHGIPHASACGGHARCSTCRVLVVEHPENLSPPTEAETRLAARKGHFMNPSLLHSQFETLEPPEDALVVDIAPPPEVVAAQIRRELGL